RPPGGYLETYDNVSPQVDKVPECGYSVGQGG
ncbi:unnamed protein product, partial [marine sediment metagenome]